MADAENKAKLNSFLNDIVRVGSVQVSEWVLVMGCVHACVRVSLRVRVWEHVCACVGCSGMCACVISDECESASSVEVRS